MIVMLNYDSNAQCVWADLPLWLLVMKIKQWVQNMTKICSMFDKVQFGILHPVQFGRWSIWNLSNLLSLAQREEVVISEVLRHCRLITCERSLCFFLYCVILCHNHHHYILTKHITLSCYHFTLHTWKVCGSEPWKTYHPTTWPKCSNQIDFANGQNQQNIEPWKTYHLKKGKKIHLI